MNSAWEEVWDAINAYFRLLATTLRSCNPNLWWACVHSENAKFPFRAHATFSREGIPGDEDIVVSLTFKLADSKLLFFSDISRGNGSILAEGPTMGIPLSTDTCSVRQWILGATRSGLRFVDDNRALLRDQLSPMSP